MRPARARRDKPRVSAFISADIPKILALNPDLVLTFFDPQADIVRELIRNGVAVHAFNQRTIAEIPNMIRTLGALTGANKLADELAAHIEQVRRRSKGIVRKSKVYFEEWDQPMIMGIARVSE